MTRLFVAIDLPGQVKEILAALPRGLPMAKWVAADHLHLTLRFIGDVDDDTFAAIALALKQVSFAPFPLTLCGVGHFPPGRHPHVVWVGMEQSAPLLSLQHFIEAMLAGAGIPPEDRPFSPHITLARLRDAPPNAVERFEKEHLELVCPTFQADRFILYSSLLTRQGAIHTQEAVYPAGS
ncbi:RNA 2',3'-cyclic phosphodiesterase [Geomonas sp. Red32]|uniref:RNA 2',3'-cyclic phosphodiesterase n=1 Tax=Geomonas sp. Red32 TaxID=2912856 RepID=UPI00202CD4A7|nr:RNA 2',3'-cyclic phosphodiesterase [Geomonas sp. Red32]MCM0080909.1 RNA 2',3'-cyclic phosphodiesterase [Geomonas sp. Red32]